MAKGESKQGYSFSLTGIQVIEKSFFTLPSGVGGKDQFGFQIGLQIGRNSQLRECIHKMRVDVVRKKDRKKAASIEISCSFHIDNYEQIAVSADESDSFPPDLLYLLNSVVIGTMRGIMFTEFRGTILEKIYLPVLDPRRFEKADN